MTESNLLLTKVIIPYILTLQESLPTWPPAQTMSGVIFHSSVSTPAATQSLSLIIGRSDTDSKMSEEDTLPSFPAVVLPHLQNLTSAAYNLCFANIPYNSCCEPNIFHPLGRQAHRCVNLSVHLCPELEQRQIIPRFIVGRVSHYGSHTMGSSQACLSAGAKLVLSKSHL